MLLMFLKFFTHTPGFPPIQKQVNRTLPSYSQYDSRLIILWTREVYGSRLTILWTYMVQSMKRHACSIKKQSLWFQPDHILGHICPEYCQPGTINLYDPEYSQPGAIRRKLGRSQLTHALMKLQDIPQPKCQYNHQKIV